LPELPEVTVISEDIRALAAGKKVIRAEIFRDDVSNAGLEGFRERLVGRVLEGVGRRGKITTLDFGDVVGVVHLVISGRVLQLPDRKSVV
jgi:formamidopyrimidine-DNA glycosylase